VLTLERGVGPPRHSDEERAGIEGDLQVRVEPAVGVIVGVDEPAVGVEDADVRVEGRTENGGVDVHDHGRRRSDGEHEPIHVTNGDREHGTQVVQLDPGRVGPRVVGFEFVGERAWHHGHGGPGAGLAPSVARGQRVGGRLGRPHGDAVRPADVADVRLDRQGDRFLTAHLPLEVGRLALTDLVGPGVEVLIDALGWLGRLLARSRSSWCSSTTAHPSDCWLPRGGPGPRGPGSSR
jgi:hypothetical protein